MPSLLSIAAALLLVLGCAQLCVAATPPHARVVKPDSRSIDNIITVTMYGAVGDGVTDDTAAVYDAMHALLANLNSTVNNILYFPRGFYLLSSSPLGSVNGYPVYIPIPVNAQTSYMIQGESMSTTTIIWSMPSLGDLFSFYSSNPYVPLQTGSRASLSQISIQTSALACRNAAQAIMFTSTAAQLVVVHYVNYTGFSPKDQMTVFSVTGDGLSSGFIITQSSGIHGTDFIVVSDMVHTLVRQLSVYEMSLVWEGNSVQEVLIHQIAMYDYTTAINLYGDGTTDTLINAQIGDSMFTCSDDSSAFPCKATISAVSNSNVYISNSTFSDTVQMSAIHLQPSMGVIQAQTSSFNGGAAALLPLGPLTTYALIQNMFTGPFANAAVVVDSTANEISVTENECSGVAPLIINQQGCNSTSCVINNNSGCTMKSLSAAQKKAPHSQFKKNRQQKQHQPKRTHSSRFTGLNQCPR